MRNWLRNIACRLFSLVPREDVQEGAPEAESGWSDLGDLWEVRGYRAVWPRIVTSDEWRVDLEPWFRQMLLMTFVALAKEQDEKRIARLQERANLLNEFLEVPRLAMLRVEAAMDNARGKGNWSQFDQMLQANQPKGVRIPTSIPDPAERAQRA